MLTKYLSLLEHTIRWHFPASFETGYGITRLQSMEYGWIYTYHFQVSQSIEVKDSGPSGHGRSKLYFICNCSLPHLPRAYMALPMATGFPYFLWGRFPPILISGMGMWQSFSQWNKSSCCLCHIWAKVLKGVKTFSCSFALPFYHKTGMTIMEAVSLARVPKLAET